MKKWTQAEQLEILEKNFPAVEPALEAAFELEEGFDRVKILKPYALGFELEKQAEDLYLYLPDKEALEANWNQLRQTNRHLPPLRILSSEGIADDKQYIESYLTHDFILSTGVEFIHDSVLHAMPTLIFIITQPSLYAKHRGKIRHLLKKYYNDLTKFSQGNSIKEEEKKYLPQLYAILGSMTDRAAAAYNENYAQESFNELNSEKGLTALRQMVSEEPWRVYFERRFGTDFNLEMIERIWLKMQ